MKHLLMGVAALALATGAYAKPGNGNGNGNGGGNGAAQSQSMKGNGGGSAKKADRGPGMAMNANKGPSMKADKAANGPAMKAAKVDKGPSMKAANANGNGNAGVKMQGNGNGNGNAAVRTQSNGKPDMARVADRGGVTVLDDGRRVYAERGARDWWGDYDQRGLIDGCPPGLAKKNPPCVPPGLARARDDDYRYRYATYRPDWWGLSSLGLGSGNYFYDDGYLMRYNGDRVSGYIPLLGGALSIGNTWPTYYAPRPVPTYFQNYYNLGPQGGYRYADNVLYRVDPQTAAITSIAALLTGDDIQIGSPMPMGYDVYNVPYPYRSQYYDSPDAYYRYSDGYVYQMDPTTRLVTAAIELLAS